jgi:hypothetical protein
MNKHAQQAQKVNSYSKSQQLSQQKGTGEKHTQVADDVLTKHAQCTWSSFSSVFGSSTWIAHPRAPPHGVQIARICVPSFFYASSGNMPTIIV